MKELKKLTRQIKDNLTLLTKASGEEIIIFKENAPKELKEWCVDMMGDYSDHNFIMFDELYTVLSDLCDIVNDDYNKDDADRDTYEALIYDRNWAHVSNYDLITWMRDLNMVSEVDEVLSEGSGINVISAIEQAMQQSRVNMAINFLNQMIERTGDN